MSLGEFLTARIGEDEAAIRSHWHGGAMTDEAYYGTPYSPSRLLVECVVKRELIRQHGGAHECPVGETPGGYWEDDDPCDVLRLMSLSYVIHEHYDEAWRPFGLR